MFENICGKTVLVKSLNVNVADVVTMKMTCTADGTEPYTAEFINVSSLNIKDMSFPFEVAALEIIDNSERGYQNDRRYFVNDYEDGKISFYCEKISV